jgi:hypothetical protein
LIYVSNLLKILNPESSNLLLLDKLYLFSNGLRLSREFTTCVGVESINNEIGMKILSQRVFLNFNSSLTVISNLPK